MKHPKRQCAVTLRHPREGNRDEYLCLLRESKKHLLPWWSTAPGKRERWADPAGFDRLLLTSRLETSLRYFIIFEGSVAGGISVSNIVKGPFRSCTIGYWLGAPYTGRGLARDALTLLSHFIFKAVKLHRCEANIMPRNKPSIALVKALGFRHEGTALRYLRINNVWEDHIRWGFTREDYDHAVESGALKYTRSWKRYVEM